MSKNKALKIVEGSQPRAESGVKRGPVVIDEEQADWLTEWIRKQKPSGRSRA